MSATQLPQATELLTQDVLLWLDGAKAKNELSEDNLTKCMFWLCGTSWLSFQSLNSIISED